MTDRRSFLATLGLGSLGAAAPRAAPAPAPPIPLLTVTVAGFRHHAGMEPAVAQALVPGARLAVVLEPQAADGDALALVTPAGHRVGYVPRLDNAVPAALVRAGKTLVAEVAAFDAAAPPWQRLAVTLYQTP